MEDINPDSLKVIQNALVEPAVVTEKKDERFQFERHGYFYADPVDYTDACPVFNKIVGLKDSYIKKKRKNISKPTIKKVQIDGEVVAMNETEQALFDRYTNELELNSEIANTLARDEKLSKFYEEALFFLDSPVSLSNIVTNEVARELKQTEKLRFAPEQIAGLAKMIDDEVISNKIAKQVYEEMAKSGENPSKIVQDRGLMQISDPAKISPIIDEIISKNPDNVTKFRAGNNKLFGFFVGQVLKATGGKANPKIVNELLKDKLK